MLGPLLITLAVLGQSGDGDPAALVGKLGAARYQEREDAAAALDRLGRAALPALLEAKDAKDPEIRLRVSSLIGKIEGRLLTEPTTVRLDFEDAPIKEVVATLSQRLGFRVALMPEAAPQWRDRKVTLRDPQPVPFWKAIDRLCDAANLQYNASVNAFPQGRDRAFALYDGGMRPSAPSVDSGPFRVTVTGLHFQRDVTFPMTIREGTLRRAPNGQALPAGPSPGTGPQFSTQFNAMIQVVGEPRLAIAQNGVVRVTEAVDDRGQSLTEGGNRNGPVQRSAAYFGMGATAAIQFQATLNRPEQPGKVIRRFRGSIPVSVSTRKPNPLVVPLKGGGPTPRTARNEDAEVVVNEVKVQENTRQTTVDLTIRPLGDAPNAPANDLVARGLNATQQQIEVVDAQGRTLPWYQTNFNSDTERLTITLIPQGLDGNQAPEALRYYSVVRAATDVSFDFSDLPLP